MKNNKIGQPSNKPGKATYKTIKKTFYIKEDTLRKLQNYARWEWLGVTEAFNQVLEDGLKGKKTKSKT